MPYVRKNRKAVTKATLPYKRRAYRRNKPSGSFAKKVNAVISRKTETKQNSVTLGSLDFNGPVNNVADCLRIIPTVVQGIDGANRIGDTIQAQKIVVRGHMMINAVPNTSGVTIPTAIPSNSRLMIRAFICSIKKFSNFDDVVATTSWMPKFLKNGNTLQGLDGTLPSMYLPVNTDVVTVHKEIRKYVTIPSIFSQVLGTPVTDISNTSVSYQGSVKLFSATIKCKKLLRYDDSSFSPQNFAPIMVISYAHMDSTSADLITARINANYVSTLFFEDA